MKLKGKIKLACYLFFTFLFLTGSIWWLLDKFVRVRSEIGEDHHPAQIVLFRAHGFSAYLFLIFFGVLIHSHVRPGLNSRQRKSYKSGMGLLIAIGLLILTSSFNLFAPDGALRELFVSFHRYLGVAFPVFLALHLGAKKWGRKRN